MIEIKDLCLAYTKDYLTLCDINLEIKDGSKVTIFGEKDSGKSSLMRVLAGIIKHTSGSVLINKIPIEKIDFKNDISLGFLPTQPVFMENKTVLQNLQYVLKIRKVVKELANIKIENAIKTYDLETIANMKLKDLQYFDRVRVALARFQLRPLDVLLIDDVFERLGESDRKVVVKHINNLIKANQCSCIITISDRSLFSLVGGKQVVIDNGSLVN